VTIALLITTLNEVTGVKKVVPRIKKEWVDEILFVDGGSTDGTIEEAEKMGFKVIIQKQKGLGAAIIEGVNAIKSDNFILFGPDGNDEPEKIPQIIQKFKEGYDQVAATRFGKGSVNLDAGKIDTFGNKMFAFLVNAFFGGHLTDCLVELRIMSKKTFQELNFDEMSLIAIQQMCIRGLKKRQHIYEIIGNEGERMGGIRKMKPLPVGASLSLEIIKEFIHWKTN
jgi:glycosyltransferase involved in cell wall biosynthesis|tara:strand:+ start:678 stop:1352 length:675 start_codon:yes stop_codon:yes gene_type:complete